MISVAKIWNALKKCLKHQKGTCDIHVLKISKNVKNVRDEELKNIHVDIPMDELTYTVAENFADAIVEDVFYDIWSKIKKDLKELSKKELSKEMFGAGVYIGIQAFMDSMHDIEKSKEIEPGK